MTRPKVYHVGVSGDIVEWIEALADKSGMTPENAIQILLTTYWFEAQERKHNEDVPSN